jgi:hypothetical protein
MSYFTHKVNHCRKSPFVFFDLLAQFLEKQKVHASKFCRSHVIPGTRPGPSRMEWRVHVVWLKTTKKNITATWEDERKPTFHEGTTC